MTLQSGTSESFTTKTKCLVCGSRAIQSSDGFIVCTECGTCQDREIVQGTFVMGDSKYEGPSQFTNLGNKMHVANAKGSQIGYPRRHSIFRTSKILRLKRTHFQTVMRVEQRLIRGFKKLNKAAVHLQLPEQTRDRAAYLLRKTHHHFKHSHTEIIICVLLLAVREHQLPITENNILDVIPIKSRHKSQLNKAKFILMETLGIKWPRMRPEWFIPKIINAIRKNPKVLERLEKRKGTLDYFSQLERISIRLIRSMTFVDYGGKSPDTLAASAIYTIDSRLLHVTTQENVGEAFRVTGVSVRDHHNRFWRHKSDHIEELLGVAE